MSSSRLRLLDVAAEAQRQVIVVGLGPPAAARQRHAQPEKFLALLGGDLDAGEEARHGTRLLRLGSCS